MQSVVVSSNGLEIQRDQVRCSDELHGAGCMMVGCKTATHGVPVRVLLKFE
jgi:hypothetical protein